MDTQKNNFENNTSLIYSGEVRGPILQVTPRSAPGLFRAIDRELRQSAKFQPDDDVAKENQKLFSLLNSKMQNPSEQIAAQPKVCAIPSCGNVSVDVPPNDKMCWKQPKIVNHLAQSADKIVDYLATGKYHDVLIRFHHGLGDTLLMYASGGLEQLRAMFPDINIYWHVRLGQEDLFGNVSNDPLDYDIVFEIEMPVSEWDRETWNKAEKCLALEFGLDVLPKQSNWKLPFKFTNPLIGFHFHSTCKRSLCAPYDSAKLLWEYVQGKNFIPIETHLHHVNSHTMLFDFERTNVECETANLPKLMGLLSACAGFAGTASGNFHASLFCFPPQKILFLKTDFSADRITHLPVHELDIREPDKIDFSVVDKWLEDCASD